MMREEKGMRERGEREKEGVSTIWRRRQIFLYAVCVGDR